MTILKPFFATVIPMLINTELRSGLRKVIESSISNTYVIMSYMQLAAISKVFTVQNTAASSSLTICGPFNIHLSADGEPCVLLSTLKHTHTNTN